MTFFITYETKYFKSDANNRLFDSINRWISLMFIPVWLGQDKTDSISRLIQLSVIQLSGGHCSYNFFLGTVKPLYNNHPTVVWLVEWWETFFLWKYDKSKINSNFRKHFKLLNKNWTKILIFPLVIFLRYYLSQNYPNFVLQILKIMFLW